MKYNRQTMIDIFKIASNGKFEFVARSREEAYRMRQMLYYHRRKLREINDPFFLQANNVVIEIDNKTFKLVAQPHGYKTQSVQTVVDGYNKKRKSK